MKNWKMNIAAAAAGVSTFVIPAVALAEGEDPYATISTAVSSGLSTVQTSALSVIGTVIPYALVVMGASLVITIGIKAFKRVAGK